MRQTDVRAHGTFDAKRATILHRRQRCFQTDQNEISHDPRHLGAPSGASKMISEPMVRSMQTVHLCCVKICTISKQAELLVEPRHLGVPSGASKTISESMVHLVQTIHQSRTDTSTVPKRRELTFHMTHITLEFHRVHPK